MLRVLHVPAFEDNYIWLIVDDDSRATLIVDPGDEQPVFDAIEREHLKPAGILCTHGHFDHSAGIGPIASRYQIPAFGPRLDIEGVTHRAGEGDTIDVEGVGTPLQVIETPGHTLDHLCYLGPGMLFSGDTLFAAGCGRLMGGSAGQMHRSLARLAALDGETRVYCAHEYTLANLKFAAHVDPGNTFIPAYREQASRRLAAGIPSLPTLISQELQVNPFLRTSDRALIAAACRESMVESADDVSIFATLRRMKDSFR